MHPANHHPSSFPSPSPFLYLQANWNQIKHAHVEICGSVRLISDNVLISHVWDEQRLCHPFAHTSLAVPFQMSPALMLSLFLVIHLWIPRPVLLLRMEVNDWPAICFLINNKQILWDIEGSPSKLRAQVAEIWEWLYCSIPLIRICLSLLRNLPLWFLWYAVS